jgi:hypothetical protein
MCDGPFVLYPTLFETVGWSFADSLGYKNKPAAFSLPRLTKVSEGMGMKTKCLIPKRYLVCSIVDADSCGTNMLQCRRERTSRE